MIEVVIYWDSGTLTYSNISNQYSTYQTLPYLKEISDISRALLLDYSIENSTVEIMFDNSTGHFTSKTVNDDGLGCQLEVKDNGDTIFTGWICDFPDISSFYVFSIKADIFSALDCPVGKKIKNYMPYGNILYGTANLDPAIMTAYYYSVGKYHAAFNPLSVLLSAQKPDGTSVFSNCSVEIDPTTQHTYILYSSPEPETHLTFSALGPESEGSLIENPAEMFFNLVSNFSEFQTETENIQEAANIFNERNYSGNVFLIDDHSTWIRFMKVFSKNFNCRVFISRTGKIRLKVIRWGMETPVLTIHPTLVKDFSPHISRDRMIGKLVSQYQYINPQKKYLQNLEFEGHPKINRVEEIQQQMIITETTSSDVTAREVFFQKQKIYMYSFSIPGKDANQIELGDTVLLKSQKNYFKDEYRQVQILRERRTPGTGFVQFTGYDMTAINKRTFILQDEDHPEVAVLQETENESPILW